MVWCYFHDGTVLFYMANLLLQNGLVYYGHNEKTNERIK